MFSIKTNLNKTLFLQTINQEEAMEYYLGIPVEYNTSINSPLHTDNNPSAGFYIKNGILIFNDFRGYFEGDVIDVVKYQTKKTTEEAINIIKNNIVLKSTINSITKIKKETIIKIQAQPFTEQDKNYWNQYHITKKTLKYYKVYSCKYVWLNSKYPIYTYNKPIYGYYFGNNRWKIYFPFNKKYRFLCNTNCLQGYNQLPKKGELLIVTKSLKECMLFYELGISAIALQAENQILTKQQYNELSKRFKVIVSNMDYDRAGIKVMCNMRREYNIQPYTFTDRLNNKKKFAKDLSDYCSKIGFNKTKELIDKLWKDLKY